MRIKSILNGSNRQFIKITDVELLEYCETLLPFYKSFNALINDALRFGLPLLVDEKVGKKVTLADEPKNEESSRLDELPRGYEKALDPRIGEVMRLLNEIIMYVNLDKAMTSALFNAKIEELRNRPELVNRFSRGLMNQTPDCLYASEINMLKELKELEEDK